MSWRPAAAVACLNTPASLTQNNHSPRSTSIACAPTCTVTTAVNSVNKQSFWKTDTFLPSAYSQNPSMAFLFGRAKQRDAPTLVRSTRELLQKLAGEEKPNPKVKRIARNLSMHLLI